VTVDLAPVGAHAGEYRHEALFYSGIEGFLDGTLPFIREAVRLGEPILVVVSPVKIALLREALGDDASSVEFAEMGAVGVNPARIIPAWRAFVSAHAGEGRSLRGIGEPIYPERSAAELSECHRHEALLNLAFADTPGFWLLCPYDVTAFPTDVLHEAACNHPYVAGGAFSRPSSEYRGAEAIGAPFDEPLPEPGAEVASLAFGDGDLRLVRRFVESRAVLAGLDAGRVADLVLAASELATNSVKHAGGAGTVRLWSTDDAVLCEVEDTGRIEEPLVGRLFPASTQTGGRGLWIANQVCDLVQVRAFADGGIVRLHVRR
jgi:anti-sigma regulatory factor (Ser/Thr protein kinase)